MAEGVTPSVLELLDWVSRRERTYRETMDAWRTSCPRLSAWEDAVGAGLVAVARGNGGEPSVVLTERARAVLAARA